MRKYKKKIMQPIPIPSRIHYELLLELLEKKTILAVGYNTQQYEQVQQLIVTVRKALALQKQFEENCQLANLPLEPHWSLNKPEKY